MKNNKLTRKRAARLASAGVTVSPDGTEVLHSKESRAKNRRWTFEADIIIVIPPSKKDTGEDIPEQKLPARTVKLDAVAYGDTKTARADCRMHEGYLRGSNAMLSKAEVHVRAIPHETVSNETMRQLMGYRDMSALLDKALELAIRDASDVALGKSMGSQFVETAAIDADGDTPAQPARTIVNLKESFYERAQQAFKSESILNAELDAEKAVVITDAASDSLEEAKPFVPEIVKVHRTAAVQE